MPPLALAHQAAIVARKIYRDVAIRRQRHADDQIILLFWCLVFRHDYPPPAEAGQTKNRAPQRDSFSLVGRAGARATKAWGAAKGFPTAASAYFARARGDTEPTLRAAQQSVALLADPSCHRDHP